MAGNTLEKLKQLLDQAKSLVDDRGVQPREERPATSLYRFAHFWVMVVRSFIRNRCLVRASSLAYTTLLGLIPMLAVAFSVATSLIAKEGEAGQRQIEKLIEQLVANVAPMLDLVPQGTAGGDGAVPRVIGVETGYRWAVPMFETPLSSRQEVARHISEFINNIQIGTIGVTSVIVFILVAIFLLRAIEETFNDIWGIGKGRGWGASFVQYWAGLTLSPLLLLLGSSQPVVSSMKWVERIPWVGSFAFFMLACLVSSVACGLLYKLIPNTYVQIRAAAVGGLVSGTLVQLNNKLNILYFSNVATTSKIYGSLGAIPVFLLGLYISWIIVLLGAQVAYAFQNYRSYMQERLAEVVHEGAREFLALRIMVHLVGKYLKNGERASPREIAHELGIPSALTNQIIEHLAGCDLLVRTAEMDSAYVPARLPTKITAWDVILAMREGVGQGMVTRDDVLRRRVREAFGKIRSAEQGTAMSLNLSELAISAEDETESGIKGDRQASEESGAAKARE